MPRELCRLPLVNIDKVPVDVVVVQDFSSTITLVSDSDYALKNCYVPKVKPQTRVQSLLAQFENENLLVRLQKPYG